MEIITTPLTLDIYGFSGTATDRDYAGTAFRLMDRMWKVIKGNNLENKGLNIWVYEPKEIVFAGVELIHKPDPEFGLEHKEFVLEKYAMFKHVGAYQRIKNLGQEMRDELEKRNLKITSPYVEIYGHWTNDESRLETDLIMALG